MRKLGAGVSLIVGTVAFLSAMTGPASAAHATGCTGSGISISKDGIEIDRAGAPGRGGTFDDPFDLETNGRVRYQYRVNGPIAGGTWTAAIDTGLFGDISFGGTIKSSSKQSGSGTEPLKKHLEFGGLAAMVGKMKVKVTAKGPNGTTCVVTGWIKLHHSIFTTPAFYLALILLVLAFLLGFFAMGHP